MSKTFIIAEAGVNHNGNKDLALKLVETAHKSGADAVKFQTFITDNIVTQSVPQAKYQSINSKKKESQYSMLKKLELSNDLHFLLRKKCQSLGIEFMSTAFDIESLNFLTKKLKVKRLKIPSGEITNAPFLLDNASKNKKIILSTGMSTLKEIENALAVLAYGMVNSKSNPNKESFFKAYYSNHGQKLLKKNVTLLHCTTAYPTPPEHLNLLAIDKLINTFNVKVGFSDHSNGIHAAIAAVSRGAVLIEKHFTLNRSLKGPDHKASLEPNELKEMVKAIRYTEKALGSEKKIVTKAEKYNLAIVRKSIIAKTKIKKGEILTNKNISIKRPGTGKSPFKFWTIIGKKATKNYKKDDLI